MLAAGEHIGKRGNPLLDQHNNNIHKLNVHDGTYLIHEVAGSSLTSIQSESLKLVIVLTFNASIYGKRFPF
ncbi:hypothetical protein MRY16398_15210 [Phytobacter sp. MRY16-398]|nr:hypothetical protein MRY16398_15210 [Phytobacter sp. MRY16-398]